jgi:broad specificity phosphatase PhoE
LTNHGVLQASRLGQHLACTDVKISHIFSSDLIRAFKTAEAIRLAQPKPSNEQAPFARETRQLALIREQDFGSLEGKAFYERSRDSNKTGKELYSETHKSDADFRDVESQEAMRVRSDIFINEYILELLYTVPEAHAVVIVAHGIILAHLWRCILRRFHPTMVSVAPGAIASERGLTLEHLGGWANTGYLELEIKTRTGSGPTNSSPTPAEEPQSASTIETEVPATTLSERKPLDMSLVVKAVNSLEHLKGVKKTRGGIGSSKHDESQKTMESFFKKRKTG